MYLQLVCSEFKYSVPVLVGLRLAGVEEGEREDYLVVDITDELPLSPSELLPQL